MKKLICLVLVVSMVLVSTFVVTCASDEKDPIGGCIVISEI